MDINIYDCYNWVHWLVNKSDWTQFTHLWQGEDNKAICGTYILFALHHIIEIHLDDF